jgi:hypothetical protein
VGEGNGVAVGLGEGEGAGVTVGVGCVEALMLPPPHPSRHDITKLLKIARMKQDDSLLLMGPDPYRQTSCPFLGAACFEMPRAAAG